MWWLIARRWRRWGRSKFEGRDGRVVRDGGMSFFILGAMSMRMKMRVDVIMTAS